MRARRIIVIMALIVSFGSSWGHAQDSSVNVPETPNIRAVSARADDRVYVVNNEWRFLVAPYFWMVGINANVSKQGTRGATAGINLPWYNLVPDYFSKVFGAMGRIEVWKGPWGLFVDNVYIYVGENLNHGGSRGIDFTNLPVPVHLSTSGSLKVIVRQGFLDVGGRYLLATLPLSSDKPLPVLTCEILGGVRYNWYNQSTDLTVDATLTGPLGQQQISRRKDFDLPVRYMVVEPMLGLRTGFWFTDKLNLLFTMDIGGFGMVAYQDFNSNLEALVGYKIHDQIRLYLGYRGRYYAFNLGSDSVKSYGWYHGPMLGAVFAF